MGNSFSFDSSKSGHIPERPLAHPSLRVLVLGTGSSAPDLRSNHIGVMPSGFIQITEASSLVAPWSAGAEGGLPPSNTLELLEGPLSRCA